MQLRAGVTTPLNFCAKSTFYIMRKINQLKAIERRKNMFREIRTNERITENSVRNQAYNDELMRILDRRISSETKEDLKKLHEKYNV